MELKGDVKFKILSYNEVFGDNKSQVIRELGTKCTISDFAILLGGSVAEEKQADDDNSLEARTGYWYLSSSDWLDKVFIVGFDGEEKTLGNSARRDGGIRPVIQYSEISGILPNEKKSISYISEVEYGEYPQNVVDSELGNKLEIEYSAGRLRKTGKKYTTDSRWHDNYNKEFAPIEHEEYEYNGKKYVCVKSKANNTNYILSNGKNASLGYYWVEVLPIKWYVDEEAKLLISKICLASGIRISDSEQFNIKFRKTDMYKFLNKYFAKEIIPENKLVDKVDEKESIPKKANHENIIRKYKSDNKTNESKLELLISQIYSYFDKVPNTKGIAEEIDDIVKEYNDRLKKLSEDIKNNTPHIETLSSITSDLEFKLRMILDDLEKRYDTYKEYFNMIDVIDEYISVVKGKEIQEKTNELSNDINTIMSVCLPFLKEENANQIKVELLNALNNQKQEILNYINSNNNLNKNINYKTVNEMVLELRKKIHPILERLSVNVNKRDLELEIKESMKKVIEGIYEEPRNKYVAFFLNEINDTYSNITNSLSTLPLNLQEEYKKELESIMTNNIDYEKDIKSITADLRNMWSSLIKLLDKIEKYNNSLEDIEDSYIDLNELKR